MSMESSLQIEMAAKGCISGMLAEWPMLRVALDARGCVLPPDTPAKVLQDLCREITK